jgi:hypothetical protein
MANTEITYCNGKGCILRSQCRRFQDGQRIIANQNGDTNQHRWMDNCDPDDRELFISTEK